MKLLTELSISLDFINIFFSVVVAVLSYCAVSGISRGRNRITERNGFLKFNVRGARAEKLHSIAENLRDLQNN